MAAAAAAIRPMRLASLTRSRCSIFQTAYNPTSARTGAKYLRARLRGPSMVKYYTPEANIAQIMRQWPELEMRNFAEEERLQDVEDKKKRGKGAPKKAKEKGDSRRASRRR
ncbi:mitochondrial ribosomal subunit S27-domain-containing protein [Suillus subalutaceus]|uniref:mitochondrial ribosomal subunit S27-domain-containing protein n=1 Tax=Suillus subalutaceus TaxID=48586 RepID=UPI001B88721F|nr:mitochondrial ribosomal subunit S27-domain-containing protein [Suillus subalutaceus]KAG1856637.1 mitochondrial ribosomal subunit S27-domain-containing protein [Suillus subalutaceus]